MGKSGEQHESCTDPRGKVPDMRAHSFRFSGLMVRKIRFDSGLAAKFDRRDVKKMDVVTQLRKLANGRGLEIVDRGQGHIQLIGGPLLVNYYPLAKKRSAYVAGTTSRVVNVTPEQVVEMAFRPPQIASAGHKDERKGNYRPLKRRMLRGRKKVKCHWCPAMIGLDDATIDHVIPLYRGGLDNANNRVLACEPCNHKRGHAMPELL